MRLEWLMADNPIAFIDSLALPPNMGCYHQVGLTRPPAAQEKKTNQFKRNPLDIDALIAKLPKWTSP